MTVLGKGTICHLRLSIKHHATDIPPRTEGPTRPRQLSDVCHRPLRVNRTESGEGKKHANGVHTYEMVIDN